VHDLLAGYQALLDGATQARHGARLPRRLWARATLRLAVEHVRASLGLLERRYRAHRALGGSPDASASDARERAADLAASLPPSPSRVEIVWLTVAVLVLARILLALAQPIFPSQEPTANLPGKVTDPAEAIVDQLSALNPGNAGQITTVVLTTNLLATSVALVILGIAAYCVLRPLASGAIALLVLCGAAGGPRGRSLYREERLQADRLDIGNREHAVFSAGGIEGPAYPHIDLIAKACLAAPLVLFAAALWSSYLGGSIVDGGGQGFGVEGGIAAQVSYSQVGRLPELVALAVAVASIGVARLTWLALKHQRREAARLPFGLPARRRSPQYMFLAGLLTVATAFALLAVPDRRAPSVWVLTTPITHGGLDRREIKLHYACDEPCTLTHLNFSSDMRRGSAAELAGHGSERKTLWELMPAQLREGLESVPRRRARVAVRRLSAPEARQLRTDLKVPEIVGIEVSARVQDGAGNARWSTVFIDVGAP
jgi:hypothetical protein